MSKTFLQALLFASVAVNAGLLLFFAGVFRKMMNDLDEATFGKMTELLYQYSIKSPYMIIVLNLPLIFAIPWYWMYGFGNWWITAGLILWLVAGSLGKILKLPVYKELSFPKTGAEYP